MGAGCKQLDSPVLLSSRKITTERRNSSGRASVEDNEDTQMKQDTEEEPKDLPVETSSKTVSVSAARWRQMRRATRTQREVLADATPTSQRKIAPRTAFTVVRWLAAGQASSEQRKKDGEQVENGLETDNGTIEFGIPPPAEEPHCYSICDDDFDDEQKDLSLAVSSESIRAILTDHMRSVGGRLQLFKDLELDCVDAENIGLLLKSCTTGELNALHLYASLLGRGDLIPGFHAARANLHHVIPEHGITPLHLCAFSDCLVGVWYLIKNGANVKVRKPFTPFQYAAFGNAHQVAKYFLGEGMSQENPPGLDSVLHCAARSNALQIIKLVATNNPALNRLDGNGYAPIHYAVEREHLECLMALLDAGCQVDTTTSKDESALHLAADAGCLDILNVLLRKGADVARKNHRGQTALHLAAKAHSLESVQVLLRSGGSDPNAEDKDGRTPLHVALGRSLLATDVTEFLIAWKADVNKPDKYGYTPLHVAAFSELSRCVDVLIQHGADLSARTTGGTTALSIILRKTPSSLAYFKQRLDSSVALRQRGRVNGEVEMRLDFHPLLDHQLEGEVGMLRVFVDEGYKEILEHPLCQSFLHVKWRKIRKYYFGRIIFYAVYVVLLTVWVTTAVAHNCFNESLQISDNSSSTPLCVNSTRILGSLFYDNPELMKSQWYVLLFVTMLEITRKIGGGISTYLTQRKIPLCLDTLSEWCVIVGVFLISFVYTGRIDPWQSHVGAFVVICGWMNLMLMLGQLSVFGTCVAMFTRVQVKFFKILLAYACLLIGFTASFFVIFPYSRTFADPWASPVKVLAMMTGDLGFDDLFFPTLPSGHNPYQTQGFSWFLFQFSTKLTFLFFLFFVTIVLMNLLVGIAVSDIQGLQKTAGLANLERRTNLVCDLETTLLGLLPRKLLQHLRWTAFIVPSCIRAVLTVRPLNPMENRLPQSVLSAAYQIAKQQMLSNSCKSTNSNSEARICRAGRVFKAVSRIKKVQNDDLDDNQNKDDSSSAEASFEESDVKREIAELKKICYQNQKLIESLVSHFPRDDTMES